MTRINLVHPSALADQHLMAEFREIKHIPAFALQRLAAGNLYAEIRDKVPKEFTLNAGHKWFFVDKMMFLLLRFTDIQGELARRGFKIDNAGVKNWYDMVNALPQWLFNGYTPTEEALKQSIERIALRISEKPDWYRYFGEVKDLEFFVEMMKGEKV